MKVLRILTSSRDINFYKVWISYKNYKKENKETYFDVRKFDFLEWKYFNQIYK